MWQQHKENIGEFLKNLISVVDEVFTILLILLYNDCLI